MKAMILAAGLGTRLKPFTDKHPKALAIVNHKTILQRNVEYLRSFGVTDIIINVHHFADQIIAHVKDMDHLKAHIEISNEENEVLETGGGLLKASWFFNDADPFFVMNADILTDLDLHEMMDFHQARKPLASLAVSKRESSRCFLFNKENELCGWKNYKTSEEKVSRIGDALHGMAFSGLHIIDPEIFKLIHLQGKFSMVDVYLHLAKTNMILGYDHTGRKFIDVGRPESIELAEKMFF